MSKSPALEVEQLTAGYGKSLVAFDISFSVDVGERISVIGRNGAGKTTLLASIAGRTDVSSGRVRIFGRDLTSLPGHKRCLNGLAYVPQEREIFPSLTVRENLAIASLPGIGSGWTIERVLDLFPSLAARLGNRGNQLSGGEQQMLAIGRAMMSNPAVLLMDEPSEGLAPVIVEQLMLAIERLCEEEKITTVLVEQNAWLALNFSPRTIAMSGGRIVFDGASKTLIEDEEQLSRLVGVEHS